jgi:hypothetical protein
MMVRETTSAFALARALAVLLLLAAASGCDDGPPVIEWPDSGADADADADTDGTTADAGCQYDDQCEDGVDCTTDRCDRTTGLCEHTPDHESCHDELQCNGYEFCDPLRGCQPSLVPFNQCNDHDACSIDICTEPENPEALPGCDHLPLDRDGDGHVDNHCVTEPGNPDAPQGDDCDDLDPQEHPGAGEFCFDALDNDCDEDVDLADADCVLQNDSCDTATEIVAGRRIEGFTFDATSEHDTGCGWGYVEVVYWFVVPEDSDVTLEVWGIDVGDGSGVFYPEVSLQTACGVVSSELWCQGGSTSVRFFERGMQAGTYYVLVEEYWYPGAFQLMLDIEPPTPPPEGDTCESPIPLATGESHTADLAEYTGDAPISCMWSSAYMDVVYELTIDEPSDVRYEVSAVGVWPYVALTETCGAPSGELSCGSGNPLTRTHCALPAGTYALVVSGTEAGQTEVTVDVSEPSEPPGNDTREAAIDVSEGGTFAGSLLCAGLDHPSPSCEYWAHHDVFYTFTLEEPRDVVISLTAEDGLTPTLAVQRDCGLPAGELTCDRGSPIYRVMRALPEGTYYLHVVGEYQADFELDVSFAPPTSVCDGAEVITRSGTFVGTTSGAGDDVRATCGARGTGADAVYRVELAEQSDLHADLSSVDFDTLLHLRTACDDPCSEIACNDWAGGDWSASAIDAVGLDAGTYYLIVDGSWWEGSYTLDVEISPL